MFIWKKQAMYKQRTIIFAFIMQKWKLEQEKLNMTIFILYQIQNFLDSQKRG